ncbi:hypothetical protein D1872_287140 [compost metagenome]
MFAPNGIYHHTEPCAGLIFHGKRFGHADAAELFLGRFGHVGESFLYVTGALTNSRAKMDDQKRNSQQRQHADHHQGQRDPAEQHHDDAGQ